MGWNGSNNGSGAVGSGKVGASVPLARKAAPSFKKGIIAGLIVIIGAGIAAFIIGRGGSPSRPQAKKSPTKQIAEVKPQIVTQKVEEVAKPEPPKETPQQKAKRERIEKLKSMTPEEREQFLYEEMSRKPIDLTPTTSQPFRTGIEMSMARIFMTEVGEMPPPLMTTFIPIQNEAHLAEILIAGNPVIEGDSEKIKEAKSMVELAKKELCDYIKDGGDAASFMQFYHSKLVDAHQERMESTRQVMRVFKEDPDIAREYLNQVNEHLREKGIKEVSLPTHIREKYNLED